MALLSSGDRRVAEAIAGIGYCNPFLPERIERERRALGPAYIEVSPVLHVRPGAAVEEMFPNSRALGHRAGSLARAMRQRLCEDDAATAQELLLYEDLALYVLYNRYLSRQGALNPSAESE